MHRSIIARLLWLVALFSWLPAPAAATDQTPDAMTYPDSLVLVLDGVDEELAAYGLSGQKLRQVLVADLEAADVRVLDASLLASDGRIPVLTFRLRLIRAPYYFFLYNVKLTLNSQVELADGGGYTTLPTWTDGWTGAIMPTDVDQINGYAKELLARFLARRNAK